MDLRAYPIFDQTQIFAATKHAGIVLQVRCGMGKPSNQLLTMYIDPFYK